MCEGDKGLSLVCPAGCTSPCLCAEVLQHEQAHAPSMPYALAQRSCTAAVQVLFGHDGAA